MAFKIQQFAWFITFLISISVLLSEFLDDNRTLIIKQFNSKTIQNYDRNLPNKNEAQSIQNSQKVVNKSELNKSEKPVSQITVHGPTSLDSKSLRDTRKLIRSLAKLKEKEDRTSKPISDNAGISIEANNQTKSIAKKASKQPLEPPKVAEISGKVIGKYCIAPKIPASEVFTEADLTFATQANIEYLDHLVALAKIWNGPITAAIYTTNESYPSVVQETLAVYRNCYGSFRRKVSIIPFYQAAQCPHLPSHTKTIDQNPNHRNGTCCLDCLKTIHADFQKLHTERNDETSKHYPHNTGRNIAKNATYTNLFMVADSELKPSRNFTARFLQFYNSQNYSLTDKKVFVVPLFEAEPKAISKLKNVSRLVEAIKRKTVQSFHNGTCHFCHKIPEYDNWINDRAETVSVHSQRKWINKNWEPVYISGKNIPPWNEQFTGAGYNKIEQTYRLCRADFNFLTLSGLFLVHEGIKKKSHAHDKTIIKENKRKFIRLMPTLDRQNGGPYQSDENGDRCFWKYNGSSSNP